MFQQAKLIKNIHHSGYFHDFCQVGMRFAFYYLVENQE
jgi:hypothetical protein